jgi:fibrillarin-like rRNA methylase
MSLRSAKEKKKYEQIIKQQDNMYAKWKNYKSAPCAIIIGKPNHFINLKLESDWSSFFLSWIYMSELCIAKFRPN